MKKALLVAGAVFLLLSPALGADVASAASEQEWTAFRADVSEKCLAAAEPLFATATATVDPFGSERYGMALIRGQARGTEVGIAAICVYDKTAKTAEIGGELPTSAVPVAGAALPWSDLLRPCAEAAPECGPAFVSLGVDDQLDLLALPDRVAATIVAVEDRSFADRSAAVLDRVRNADAAAPLDGVSAGEHACTVYDFGFLDNGGRRVGAHRCRISRTGTGLLIEKLTGERLSGEVLPISGGAGLLVGRTYLPEHADRRYDPLRPANAENQNFGNTTGIVFADGSGLLIVSADLRGFTEPDDTFFGVLVIE